MCIPSSLTCNFDQMSFFFFFLSGYYIGNCLSVDCQAFTLSLLYCYSSPTSPFVLGSQSWYQTSWKGTWMTSGRDKLTCSDHGDDTKVEEEMGRGLAWSLKSWKGSWRIAWQRKVKITELEMGRTEDVRWGGNWQEEDQKWQNSVGREEGEKTGKGRVGPEVATKKWNTKAKVFDSRIND